ncbi:S-layer homology domain-containing protein [Cohnella sp. WQ 127256]|uniref:S-layer homology domain-containing protein n=1 Tax=Cohnella sp. WQ 127256 TaxID=2938790 RepID=UPI0021178373|nr:S-layer homology domain-containing protein [Cohnella sp. WQ 127256]
MRDSSYNYHTQTKQIHSRGGEKKVMKKSLSLLLSIALVFGLFASMASAAETAAPTTQEKYDQLVKAGVLKGNPDGDAKLADNLTRAEFATIAIALAGLPAEKTGNSFTDVTAKQWWYGAIEAAAKAGLVEGYNGKFKPADKVTIEEVIKVAVQIAKVEPVKDAKIEGASDWAGPYIQAALDKGLIATGLNYKANATRGQTIDVGYPLYAATLVPAKVSVKEAKATGVQQVTVTLDKAVDVEKAKLSLKKGSVAVTLGTVKWSEDKKVATLPLKDVKISEGEYTVTLSGLAADEVAVDNAKFTGAKEVVSTIEFVSSVAEIAYTAKAKVKVAAKNQYGELASYAASNYSVFTGYAGMNERVTKSDDGHLVIVMDTNVSGIYQNQSQIPVTVYFNDTRLTATKSFKVGNAPFVTKMELGAVKYDGTKTSLSNAGEIATVPVSLFDQYGNPVTKDQSLSTAINWNEFITPQPNKLTAKTDDYNNDDEYETKITLSGKEAKSSAYTLTVYAGGTSATQTINVGNGKVATKLAFGDFDKVVAQGDTAKNFFIPVIGYDVDGNQLTKDELVDQTNVDRIVPLASGPINGFEFVKSGPNKGSIKISGVSAAALAKQVIFVSASITQIDAQDYKTMQITIQDKRVPETLDVVDSAAPKAVLGADADFKVLVKDQYGEEFNNLAGHNVKVTYVTLTSGSNTVLKGKGTKAQIPALGLPADSTLIYGETEGSEFNKGFTFDTKPNHFGEVQFKAELIKLAVPGVTANDTVIKAVSQSIQSIDPTKVDLTYALKDLGNLYAYSEVSDLYADTVITSNLHKTVNVAVKDSSGTDVAFPGNLIQNLTVSNGVAVKTGKEGKVNSELDASVSSATYYVLGNKAGAASVNATVYSAKGEIVYVSGTVTVKADTVDVASISAGNGDADKSAGTFDAYDLMDLKVVDNYGIEYKGTNIKKYDALIGITYSITNVKGGTVTVNPLTNQVTIGAGVSEFLLTANAPNGKTASTLVY